MNCRSMKFSLFLIAMGIVLALAVPRVSRADGVERGWDLFETLAATPNTGFPFTQFMGIPFVGVPLGTFDFNNDFGRNLGVKNVDGTDTIVRRNQFVPNTGAVGGTTTLDMVALQLETQNQVDFLGNGLDNYFVTLQSVRGGPASTGTMDIHFQNSEPGIPHHGTFDSSIDVFFDIRKGALGGPIVLSDDLPLSSDGTFWTHFPLVGELEIQGVNFKLNGQDITADFHTNAFNEKKPGNANHSVKPTSARINLDRLPGATIVGGDGRIDSPEPGSLALFGIGSLVFGGFCWRRRK